MEMTKEIQVATPYELSQLYVPNIIDLENGERYYITLEDEQGNTKYSSVEFTLSWVEDGGSEGNASGDGGSGGQSGDCGCVVILEEISNKIDNIQTTINRNTEAIEEQTKQTQGIFDKLFGNKSGDSGEKGILEELYEEMFTLESRRSTKKDRQIYRKYRFFKIWQYITEN